MSTITPGDGFVCDLSVFTPEQRSHHLAQVETLFALALELRELPDGYAIRMPDAPDILAQLADFIAYDRLCCPFLTFSVVVESYSGPIWLRLTGPAGVKLPLAGDLAAVLPPDLAASIGR